ncbi:MAG: sugar ABC transporter ATP-binding protein, partial [Actinobacteria bacterium]|nr:sugar ABC transporter ATP-binding protein [Actinomycetota bacterium]
MGELIFKNITKSFGAVRALNNFSCSILSGEVHALLGENGAGKSTLIKLLSGAIKLDTGSIEWNKKLLNIAKPIDSIRSGIGTVYQELSLIPDLTVSQNLFLNNWLNKSQIISKKIINQKTLELFNEYDIDSINPDTMVSDLSLANKQIIEILKVINRNPEIIVLDEATSALSIKKVEWLLLLCKELAKKGKIVIFISHRLYEISNVCNRVTVLRNGQYIGTKITKETNNEELIQMMLGRKMSSYYPEKIKSAKKESILEVENLSCGKHLKNVSFDLKKGEILGVGGLAGQGQNALFLSLFGMCSYTGDIKLNGKRIILNNSYNALKNGIALVPEDRSTQGLIHDKSIRENISIASLKSISKFGILSGKTEEKKIKKMIEALHIICDRIDRPANSMSGGNQQKVVLGKFLMTEPNVLLLFDVTRGIDVGTKMEIFSIIQHLAKNGHSILYYSTDLDELVTLCERV